MNEHLSAIWFHWRKLDLYSKSRVGAQTHSFDPGDKVGTDNLQIHVIGDMQRVPLSEI